MVLRERGCVENGQIVFSQPLPLPEGTEVNVQIEFVSVPTETAYADEALSDFFGLWRGREEMQDSVAWVEEERRHWQHRSIPQD